MECRKKEIFKATHWFKVGDHPAIIKIPRAYKDFIPVQNGAMGFLDDESDFYGEPVFIFPSDWIIEDNDSFFVVTDKYFKEHFETV